MFLITTLCIRILKFYLETAHMDRVSNHGSPGRMDDNRSWQSAGGNNFKCTPPQEVEEVGDPLYWTDLKNLLIFLCISGWFTQPAAHISGLHGVHGANRSHACLVLVRLSASRRRLSGVSEDSPPSPCAQHTVCRRYSQLDQCPSVRQRSSA